MQGDLEPHRTVLTPEESPSVDVESPDAAGPIVVVCEHASCALPAALGDLGLSDEARVSHIAWDPGALAVARRVARAFDAPLVAGRYSRLVYDCNRPPEAADAIPEQSEIHAVPGNRNLSADQRAARIAEIYRPFRAAVADTLDRRCARGAAEGAGTKAGTETGTGTGTGAAPALVTMHSFTPVYFGRARAVEIGLLHDADSRLVDAMLEAAPGLESRRVERNAPYGPEDGVTHTLATDALPRGLANVMIEIRNDLIADEAGQARLADEVVALLEAGLARLPSTALAPPGPALRPTPDRQES